MIIDKISKAVLSKEERKKLERDRFFGFRNSGRAKNKGCFGLSAGEKEYRPITKGKKL